LVLTGLPASTTDRDQAWLATSETGGVRPRTGERNRDSVKGDKPGSESVVVVAARRTPIGRFLGSLSSLTAVDLGVLTVNAVRRDLAGAALPRTVPEIRRLVFGCARQAGVGPNPARQVAVRAGMGEECVAHTINMACASGLEAIVQAARLILLREADWVIAGGMESMSSVPFLLDRFRRGYRMGDARIVDAMYKDGFLCPLAEQVMGETAETLARRYRVSREEQDAYALESQRRCARAREEGRFVPEIVPVEGKEPAGPSLLAEDEHPRPKATLEGLAALPPVFAAGGTVTAGNSSGITDAAAALILTRASEAERCGVPVLARLTAWESAGVDPKVMGIGPVPAVRALMDSSRLSLAEVDLV
jgi:acetyl-CoA C-acetyltransferase